ncbi:MAG: hypothetical protein E6R04_06945 [Spirochaetes bacterium]|nr:MAG: hypothetical protein E6R04_06945 [Spirochaetota bacterium]
MSIEGNPPFFAPNPEQIDRLSTSNWCVSYSGGKDSTSVVVWIEWLRRAGRLSVAKPMLVQSNTTVEDAHLQAISSEMMGVLRSCGWECAIVEPLIREKLYNRILGIGNTPVHPGSGRLMRWCTRATKIDPMSRWRKQHASGLVITGLRLGESANRDAKLRKRGLGCAAGGECGIPPESDNTYSPLIDWTTCNVIDLLNGLVTREYCSLMVDVLPLTRQLVAIYDVALGQDGLFEEVAREVSSARFGCIGCPAISADRCAPKSTIRRNGISSPLNEIYDVWFEARRRDNRLVNPETGGRGPIKMAVRKVLFDRIMGIQQRTGVVLITPEDEVFIRNCWANKVYPRGWSEADESNAVPPLKDSLFKD